MINKPTVTDLIDLLNKPALLKWANKIGLQGITLETHRAKSKAEGTSLHKQIELFLKEGTPFKDEKVQARFDSFMEGKEVLALEQRVEHEHFHGRYDVKLKIGGATYLCDFKSSTGVYLENVLQLMAYRMVEPTDHIAVIEIPSFTLKSIHVYNPKVFEGMIRALAYIHHAKMAADWAV